jgi:hypothetical protein
VLLERGKNFDKRTDRGVWSVRTPDSGRCGWHVSDKRDLEAPTNLNVKIAFFSY